MNVAELRAALNGLPDDARIFVDGYEGGIENPRPLRKIDVKLNVHTDSWYGPHEDVDDSYNREEYGEPDCAGYILSRGGPREDS